MSLKNRGRLLRNAFFRKNIFSDIMAMAHEYGLEYRDVTANVEPFEFVRAIIGSSGAQGAPPSFENVLGSAADFTPADAPCFYNAEPSVSRFLGQLVYYRRSTVVVELGCFVGWTSAHLSLALRANGGAGKLYCLDTEQSHLDIARSNFLRLGLDANTVFLKGFSLDDDVLRALPSGIDVLFIDTSHHYLDTLNEIIAYAPLMAPSGCIVLHDSLSWLGVRRSITETGKQFRRLTFATESGNGVSVLVKDGFFAI